MEKHRLKNEYLPGGLDLSEAAKIMKCRTDYLIGMIKAGQLKAFKFGAEWITTDVWLGDFKARLKKSIHQEIEAKNDFFELPVFAGNWVKTWSKRWRWRKMALAPAWSIVLILFWSAMWSGAIYAYGQEAAAEKAVVNLANQTVKLQMALAVGAKINDETITDAWHDYAESHPTLKKIRANWHALGQAMMDRILSEAKSPQVAGDSESSL